MAAPNLVSTSSLFMFMILMSNFMINICFSEPVCYPTVPPNTIFIYDEDVDKLQFLQNLEHLDADYFLYGALGQGLDEVAPQLVMGGPPPIGAKKANLDSFTRNLITEFAYQQVGRLRVLKNIIGGFPRPLMDLSAENFAKVFDKAFESKLVPPFNPYRDSLSYMLASYMFPYMGLLGYVGINPLLKGYQSKGLLGGLLGVKAGQDAVIRMYLYERARELVKPYNYTVAEFTIRISKMRNQVALCDIRDEGIMVPAELGAEKRTISNVLSANFSSISYKRTPEEILRILYDTSDESLPGGFYPRGANGKIAREFLKSA